MIITKALVAIKNYPISYPRSGRIIFAYFYRKGVGEEGETINNKPFHQHKVSSSPLILLLGKGGAPYFISKLIPCEQVVWVAHLELDGRQ